MAKSDKNVKKNIRRAERIYGQQNSAANSARRNISGGFTYGGQIFGGGEFGDRRRLRV